MTGAILVSTTVDKLIVAFSWMLIHSLWQGLVLAIATGTALMFAKRSGAAFRYNVVLVLFILFIAGCGLTFIYEWGIAASPSGAIGSGAGNTGKETQSFFFSAYPVRQLIDTFTNYFSANAPFVIMVWFMVFLFKSVRMISYMAYNQRMRNYQVYQPSAYWTEKAGNFAKKLGIDKAVTLLQSGYIKVPVVLGHLKPVVLMPVGLMAGLPPEQIEAILLHELAHVKRNDYFVNFLQNIADAVFFFNPGLLWISSLLREERENCCDDIALEQTNNKVEFVQALISFKEHELYGQAYATAFPGKKNRLMHRVVRILNNRNKTFGVAEKAFLTLSILILSALITTVTVAQIARGSRIKVKQATVASFARKEANVSLLKKADGKVENKQYHAPRKMKNDIGGIIKEAALNESATAMSGPGAAADQIERKQYYNDQIQAELDQQQAMRDQEKAQRDQKQDKMDEQQARIYQLKALRDRADAILAQAQIEQDQAQVQKDRIQAKMDQQHLLKEKAEMDAVKVKDDN